MDLYRWWQADPLERYWMEITGRPDLGADLHAPRLDDSGEENPTYALVREVQDGDIVLHYEKRDVSAITAWSIAQGGFWEEETVLGDAPLNGTQRCTGRAVSTRRALARASWSLLPGRASDPCRNSRSGIPSRRRSRRAGSKTRQAPLLPVSASRRWAPSGPGLFDEDAARSSGCAPKPARPPR